MRIPTRRTIHLALLTLGLSVFSGVAGPGPGTAVASTEGAAAAQAAQATRLRAPQAYRELPLRFEPNQGQTDPRVRFLARGPGGTVFFTSTEVVMALRAPGSLPAQPRAAALPWPGATERERERARPVLRMKPVGANPDPAVEGREPLPGKSHYLIGGDPGAWRRDVPAYARVEYREVYPGIAVVYYGMPRRLEYDVVVAPGADPKAVRFAFEGAERLELNARGDLVVHVAGGTVIQRAPVVYQEIGGARHVVPGRYVLQGRDEVGFQVGEYDGQRPLVIDPVLSYSTYLGGSGSENSFDAMGVAVDVAGKVYLTGSTDSIDFPTVNPLQPALGGSRDAFVAKLDASGSALVYATYLGGSGGEFSHAIAVDNAGNAYVTGSTNSPDFPTANPLQPTFGGSGSLLFGDAFVAKLNAAGSALVYSTYLGGSSDERGFGIAVDAASSAYVTGSTSSPNFPTASPLQPTLGGVSDAFVAKLSPTGSTLVYSTYLGGSLADASHAIAVDSGSNAYLAGTTNSPDFPTANPLQPTFGGSGSLLFGDAFVAKLNAAGSALVYSTYLGGSSDDLSQGLAVDAAGNAYVAGSTSSTNFPTVKPWQATPGGSFDAFVAKLSPTGSTLVYSTYLGGSGSSFGHAIAVDVFGNAYVTGHSDGADFPTVNALQPDSSGGVDGFVAKLNATGTALVYSTYLGGSGDDRGIAIAVDRGGGHDHPLHIGELGAAPLGRAYVVGDTASPDFPTFSPLQPTLAGAFDAFVTTLAEPTLRDPALRAELVVDGLQDPTTMAFIATDDILVLQRHDGRVRRVRGGVLEAGAVLDVAVDSAGERGLLGIAVHPQFPTTPFVYLYYSESATGTDTSGSPPPLGNRVYRYTWNGTALTNRLLLLNLPAGNAFHNGGVMTFGPDGKLYVVIGDQDHNGLLQNFPAGPPPDDTSVIVRLNDDGTIPTDNPFFAFGGNFVKYYAYGVRNSFGLAFDPVTGKLWETENGPTDWDEVNLVEPGFNSGWEQLMGPDARDPQGVGDLVQLPGSQYSDPKFSWQEPVAPTGLVFLNSVQLGEQYQNDLFVGDFNNGAVYHFEPTAARDGLQFTDPALADLVADDEAERQLVVFGTGFGRITDLEVGPDGLLYVLSTIPGRIFRVVPAAVLDVSLSSPTIQVPRGGQVPFTVTLENTTSESQSAGFAIVLSLPTGQTAPLSPPSAIGLASRATTTSQQTLTIPLNAPLGTWTLTGLVVRGSGQILDRSSVTFTVVQ